MSRELEHYVARGDRLIAELTDIARAVSKLEHRICPFCGTPHSLGHDDDCTVLRARCLIAALDTPEERHERYLDGCTSEETE